ncbi:DUF427 domain-containing protein [Amycolatopsis acidiphila]|uniref:DUF427 domain-containing protein n=1 Tax=Amycolatopsis acidiphila TaxID=715473 RepID=A0A558A7I3_9PSEU|nr:DUF427 domain-containing protein [Amycolatopsis acidiphila]TVT20215.1 DUF427 domain-containing protein [Amycolatopsis acidiphila]UIJ58236.1 DUF427 domain-containing protein [Amycolatopsis acidiphila]GHG69252.1 hypothetical protein GCM10017788_29370 [Amycolatopsis acidiphila]
MSNDGRGRVRVEHGAKRVRVVFGGKVVADTIRPLLVWEIPYYPAYYIPREDFVPDALVPSANTYHSPSRGDGKLSTVRVDEREAVDAALEYEDSPIEELHGHIRLDFEAMDSWFEEDEEIFVHPRDPHTRVDILASSRHVRIEIDGVTVADTHSPRLLFETGLPTRYYLPKTDIRLDLLEPSDTVTHCPYKGSAEYYSVRVGDELHRDIVWYYRTPLPESQKVQGLVCFYDEKVDVFVDDVKQERPKTKFA